MSGRTGVKLTKITNVPPLQRKLEQEKTEATSIRTCNECKTNLILNKNWWFSFKGKQFYICTDCYKKRRLENHVKAGTAGPKRLAKYIGSSALDNYDAVIRGYVYIISNPAWEGWHKVGMAVDAWDRCASFQTSSPFRDYKLEYCKHFKDRRSAETETHNLLLSLEIPRKGEWFKATAEQLKKHIQSIKGERHESIDIST